MSCWSWSVPAGPEGSCVYATDYGICKSCYARANRYNTSVVAKAQWIRYNWFKAMLVEDVEYLMDTLAEAVGKFAKNGYFRIFDSGDFSDHREYGIWAEVAKRNPEVKFWVPTRTWRSENDQWINGLTELSQVANVQVRLSALEFNEVAPCQDGSMVVTDLENVPAGVYPCPKSINGSSCQAEACRTCWDNPETSVAYLVHGMMGRHKQFEISDKMLEQRLEFKEKYSTLTIGAT